MSDDSLIWSHEPVTAPLGESAGYDEMTDGKFYRFEGGPKFFDVWQNPANWDTAHMSFLSRNWDYVAFWRNDYATFLWVLSKSGCHEEMTRCARVLSKGAPSVTSTSIRTWAGYSFLEMVTPCSGFMLINSHETDIMRRLI